MKIINETLPLILTIDNFISEELCQPIIETINKNKEKARFYNRNGNPYFHPGRTNSLCWLKHNESHLDFIFEKFRHLFNMERDHFQQPQGLHYATGEKYEAHYDGFKRIKTIMIYLNTVPAGGETYFPKLDITIQPEVGKLLLFTNYENRTKKVDKNSKHAALPVISGEKWALTFWYMGAAK